MIRWIDVLRFAREGNPTPPRRVQKTDDEWRALLSAEEYEITRRKGTERPFSSESCSVMGPGRYACVCCGTELFNGHDKFDSGTGWPSFTEPADPSVVAYVSDGSLGMTRIETTCNVCDAHLGHVFPDGPKEAGGLRFCINALALRKNSDDPERSQ